jgi:hypothetical protein
MSRLLTVGYIRETIRDLPDDSPILLEWSDRIPDDSEPGIEINGFETSTYQYKQGDEERSKPCLNIMVSLFYLNDDSEDEDA